MQITEAESAIMCVLWDASPLSADQVRGALAERTRWEESTVKTLLGRLLNKGAITATKDGRRYLYAPRLPREAWLSQQCARLVDRLFDGRIAPLVAHFNAMQPLSRDDIAALRHMLDGIADDAG